LEGFGLGANITGGRYMGAFALVGFVLGGLSDGCMTGAQFMGLLPRGI